MPTTKTIEQRLTAAGYSHKRDANSANDGRHVISKGGLVLGRFDALDALRLLTSAAIDADERDHYAMLDRMGVRA